MLAVSQTLDAILDVVGPMAEQLIANANEVRAEEVGLDERCGMLFIGHDFIAVRIQFDPPLQYYGGFEYVNKPDRHVLGEYVFYSTADDRVFEHWAHRNN